MLPNQTPLEAHQTQIIKCLIEQGHTLVLESNNITAMYSAATIRITQCEDHFGRTCFFQAINISATIDSLYEANPNCDPLAESCSEACDWCSVGDPYMDCRITGLPGEVFIYQEDLAGIKVYKDEGSFFDIIAGPLSETLNKITYHPGCKP